MKILRIIYDWPPPWAGLSPHPYEVTVAQLKMGHTFDIFSGNWPKSGESTKLVGVNLHGFYRELFPGTLLLSNALFMFFYYLFWRLSNTPDLIHCHGHFAFWIYVYRAFLAKYFPKSPELKIPLVAHFHNTVEGRWRKALEGNKPIKPESKYIAWPLAKISDQTAVKVSDACIFVSTDTREDAIKYYGANPEKCFIVETGVNTASFAPIGEEELEKSRKELGFDLLDKLIVNNGAIVERKNIHLLVDAMKFLPDQYKLFLVGPSDPAYLERLNLLVKSYNIQDRVTIAGYTPYPQIPVAFQVADVFVLPSSYEGLPKVVMQSLACGTPVLASGFRLQDEIRGLIYLENLDPKYIAEQIISVTSKQKDVDRDKVLNLYSWDYKAKQIEGVYNYVFKNRAA